VTQIYVESLLGSLYSVYCGNEVKCETVVVLIVVDTNVTLDNCECASDYNPNLL